MGRSSVLQLISRLKHNLTFQTTLPASKVQMLYREPGVESGYRPSDKSWGYYATSAFQLNNETINIWSHFIAVIVFVLKFFVFEDTIDGSKNSWPCVAFGVCTIAYASMSTFAHTFHSKSPKLHYICFQLDYLGIGLYGFGANVLSLHTGCPDELYAKVRSYGLALNIPLAWTYMIGCCLAKLKYRRPYPPQRKLIQLVSGAISVLPTIVILIYRLVICLMTEDCSITTLSHHGRWVSQFFLCVFFFSSHLPEKLYPGKFDFIGQGHQLFHVLVAVASILQHEAAHIDMLDSDMSHAKLDDHTLSGVVLMFSAYLFGCGVIIWLLRSTVNKRVREDMKID